MWFYLYLGINSNITKKKKKKDWVIYPPTHTHTHKFFIFPLNFKTITKGDLPKNYFKKVLTTNQ